MLKRLAVLSGISLLTLLTASAQEYKYESITTAPAGLPAAYASVINSTGYRVSGPNGVWCEIWLAKSIPAATSTDPMISYAIAQGTLIGVLHFPAQGADRRGQVIESGLYTMRYSDFPVDGAHSGVAPQRDFALLTPIAADPDPAAKPAFEELVKWSGKASRGPHPAVLSIETPPQGAAVPSVMKEGDGDSADWALTMKSGDLTFSIIVVGKYSE